MSLRSGVVAPRIPSNTTANGHHAATKTQTPFFIGGVASCVATLVSHPFDLTKVRLQTTIGKQPQQQQVFFAATKKGRRPMIHTMWWISRTEGVKALYNGLSASLLRQGTYSTIRFGLYDRFKGIVAGNDSKLTFFRCHGDENHS